MLSTIRCAHPCDTLLGVYKVKPKHIVLTEAYGGTLTLHWTDWRTFSATGVGSSEAIGAGGYTTAHVTVALSRVRNVFISLGHVENALFTRMRIHFTHVKVHDSTTGRLTPGRDAVEHLRLTFQNGPDWTPV